jgi:hypothetical protein
MEYEKQIEIAVEWIKRMLLHGEMRLKDVPQSIRINNPDIYGSALRISNGVSNKWFVGDLTMLCLDLNVLSDGFYQRRRMLSYLQTYLNHNNYKGDEEFESFKNDISENLLSEMHNDTQSRYENIRNQFDE